MENSKKNRQGTLGWQSIQAVKQELLYRYKLAMRYSESHPVKVHHGKVAEAEFRKMLVNFLPKRYGVTAGYIVSQSLDLEEDDKLSHFDVIIYNQLDSPVLWLESSPDSSIAGTNMAIPAEYVVSVLEVKSSFEPKTVSESLNKLKELKRFMKDVDKPDERYKKYFPDNFCCGSIFFELREKNIKKTKSLLNVCEGLTLDRYYMGTLILEAEGQDENISGRTNFIDGKDPIPSIIKDNKISVPGIQIYGNPEPSSKGKYLGVMMNWTNLEFYRYLFDLIAYWNGTFDTRISSFHGFNFINE